MPRSARSPGLARCRDRSTRRPPSPTTVYALLDKAAPSGGVRLLGVAASKFAEPAEQLQLEGLGRRADALWSDASRAIDRVRGRFGGTAIGPASALSPAGLRVVRRGQHQWGTDEPVERAQKTAAPALRNRCERVRMSVEG